LKTLEGKLIRLRALEPEDLEYLYKLENNTDIWQVSNTIVPFSKYILKKYIESSHLDIYETKQLRLIIETISNKRILGTIDLFDFDPYHSRAGVGIIISNESDRGLGFADDALKVLMQYAFSVLKLHQLFCNVTTNNIPSIKLFQKNGFNIAGEKKDWLKTEDGWIGEYLLQCVYSEMRKL
jgi:diamine N-acetyltransferase